MNVLFITSWFPTKEKKYDKIFVKEHAKSVVMQGNDVIILHINIIKSKKLFRFIVQKSFDSEMQIVTLYVESLFWKCIYMFIPFQFYLLYRVYIKHIKTIFTPDIIHSHVIFPGGILGHMLANKLKKPHIITEHWSYLHRFFKKNLYGKLGKIVYKKADYILPVSNYLKSEILKDVPAVRNIRVVPNVVDGNF